MLNSINAGLPNLTGTISANMTAAWRHTNGFLGVFYGGSHTNGTATSGQNDWVMTYFDAKRSSSIYGSSNTVRPFSRGVRFMMKY